MSQIVLPYCYKITHKTTGQFYIGSRCNKSAKHYSEDFGIKYFTSSKEVKELGFENFKIDWIEEFPTKELAYDWEQMMIHVNLKDPLCLNKFSTFKNKKFSYSGKTHSEESRLKISNKAKNRIVSKETRNKMSNTRKGKKPSEEAKLKMSLSKQNISKETRNKISESLTGRIFTDEHKLNIKIKRANQIMKPVSEETRLKMSKSQSGKNNPMYGKKLSNETKLKISISSKGSKIINNGKINKKLNFGEILPLGWTFGRIKL